MADRLRIVQGVLPPGWPEAARVLTVSFGIGLIWLSRSLARRRRRAWQLAVVVVVASAVAHLAKGLDFEEATISLLLLVALVRWRGRFDVPGDPASVRPLLGLGAALAAIAAVAGGAELRGVELSPRTGDALLGLGVVFGFVALFFWLRPFGHAVAQTVGERRVVRALVETLRQRQPFVLRAAARQELPLFAVARRLPRLPRRGRARRSSAAIPSGDEAEIDLLLAELQRIVRAHGWRMAVVGASEAHLDRYRALGLKPISMGEEAVLLPQEFSLEGRAIRKVRQSVSRLGKAGYSFRVVAAEDVGPALESRARGRLRGVARRPARARLLDGDRRSPHPRHGARSRRGRRRAGRWLSPSRAVAAGWKLGGKPPTPGRKDRRLRRSGRRRLVAQRDAAPPGRAERPDGVPRRRDTRVGARHGRERALAQLLRADRLPRARADADAGAQSRPPRRSCSRTTSSSSSGSTRSTASSSRSGARATSASSASPTCRAVGLAYLHAESLLVPPGPWTRRRESRRRLATGRRAA